MANKYSCDFAITLTGSKMVKQFKHTRQHEMMIKEIGEKTAGEKVMISLVTELTPHQGDVHYHGFVRIRLDPTAKSSALLRLQNFFRGMKTVGFYLIKPIDNEVIWQDYLEKDKQRTEAEGLEHIAVDQIGKWEVIEHLSNLVKCGVSRASSCFELGRKCLEAMDTY